MLSNFPYSESGATPNERNIIANWPSRREAMPGDACTRTEDLWCCLYVQLRTDILAIVVSSTTSDGTIKRHGDLIRYLSASLWFFF